MNPLVFWISICMCVCLYMSLYVCLYVSLWVLVCVWLAMHVYMCLCVYLYVSACVFPCVCVSVCVIVGGLYVCVTMCLRIHLCAYAYVNVQMWSITWADPWRERLTGRCVHSSLPLGLIVLSWVLPGSRLCPSHQTSPYCPSAASVERKEGDIFGGQ